MSKTKGVVIIGAGGHAKVVISTLQAAGQIVAMVFDDNPAMWGTELLGIPVTGPVASAAQRGFETGVVAVGSNALRKRVAENTGLRWVSASHPKAFVHQSVRLGAGSVVFAGVVVQPDVRVGEHTIINTGATIDHDCVLGDFVHIAPGAHLAGNVLVKDGTLMGVGCSVLPGVRVGSWTVVGAGASVIRDVPDNVMVFGVPAKPKQ